MHTEALSVMSLLQCFMSMFSVNFLNPYMRATYPNLLIIYRLITLMLIFDEAYSLWRFTFLHFLYCK